MTELTCAVSGQSCTSALRPCVRGDPAWLGLGSLTLQNYFYRPSVSARENSFGKIVAKFPLENWWRGWAACSVLCGHRAGHRPGRPARDGHPRVSPRAPPARDPACETLPTATGTPAGLSLAMVQTSVGSPSAEPHQRTLSLLGSLARLTAGVPWWGWPLCKGRDGRWSRSRQPRSAGRLCRSRCAL